MRTDHGQEHSSEEVAAVHVGLIVKPRDQQEFQGIGARSYRVMPRIGEMLEVAGDVGKAHTYRVVAVLHPAEPTGAAADVYAVHVGTLADAIRQL